ncbi:MAG: DNA polymerase III subunit chi [Methylococcaceae bacterium]|nr:MAG: DNA polymerase III subunit chi [Methylococcaceae bacterium]
MLNEQPHSDLPLNPRVDFYLLPSADPGECLIWVCRLTEKAYRAGHRVHIHCRDGGEAMALDELLWRFRAASFVPHVRLGEEPVDPEIPVTLGHGRRQPEHNDVLINLDGDIPEWHGGFRRIAELVPQLPEQRLLSREHFRRYKALGYSLQTHDLSESTAQ